MNASMVVRENGVILRGILMNDQEFTGLLTARELDKALDPASYTGSAGKIVDSIVKKIR